MDIDFVVVGADDGLYQAILSGGFARAGTHADRRNAFLLVVESQARRNGPLGVDVPGELAKGGKGAIALLVVEGVTVLADAGGNQRAQHRAQGSGSAAEGQARGAAPGDQPLARVGQCVACLLYTSDAADDLLCVDLGGRRII